MSGLFIVANRLQGNAGVIALVPAAKIFLVKAQQATPLPFIVLSQASGHDTLLIGGQGDYPCERISVNCFSTTGHGAVTIGNAVKAALKNTIKASVGSYDDVDIWFADVDFTNYADTDESIFRVIDFMVRWR